jgi:hypothetical protein
VPIQYFTILDRNLLDSCESWLFSWFFNPFQKFCQFQTYDKRYGRLMKRIWDINIVFSTSFVQNYKSEGKTRLHEIHLFATASRLVMLFFSSKLGQISIKHTWNWVYLCTHICKNKFIDFMFSYLSKFAADISSCRLMLSLYSRCITLSLIDNFLSWNCFVRYNKALIGFIFAQYGKILSLDFNIRLNLRPHPILKSRLNILPYWAQKNPVRYNIAYF